MSDNKETPIVLIGIGVILLREDGKILLGKRKNAHGAGEWRLPGGRLEFGESIVECAAREVFEETGIQLDKKYLKKVTFTDSVFPEQVLQYVTLYLVHACNLPMLTDAKNMEPDKCEGWQWFDPNDGLPEPVFEPTGHVLDAIKYDLVL